MSHNWARCFFAGLSQEKKPCRSIHAPVICNAKQLEGTLSAVWLVLTAVWVWEVCVSIATVRNLTSNISSRGGEWQENMLLADLSRTAVNTAEHWAGESFRKPGIHPYTVHCGGVTNQISLLWQHPTDPPAAVPVLGDTVPCGPSRLCCRQDPPFVAKNLPAGPELFRFGFLFFFLTCVNRPGAWGWRAWRWCKWKHKDSLAHY